MEILENILELVRLISYVVVFLGSLQIGYIYFQNNDPAKGILILSVGSYFFVSLVIVLFRVYNALAYVEDIVVFGYTPVIAIMAISMLFAVTHSR